MAVDTKEGEGESPTTWVRVAIFGDKAEELAHGCPKVRRFIARVGYPWGPGLEGTAAEDRLEPRCLGGSADGSNREEEAEETQATG